MCKGAHPELREGVGVVGQAEWVEGLARVQSIEALAGRAAVDAVALNQAHEHDLHATAFAELDDEPKRQRTVAWRQMQRLICRRRLGVAWLIQVMVDTAGFGHGTSCLRWTGLCNLVKLEVREVWLPTPTR